MGQPSMDLAEATLLIKKLLKRPIAYHRAFCEMTGKACAGVMLSQAWYWSERTDDSDGWFYKTGKQWRDETGLSRTEQETARKRLIALNLMAEMERGMPCKMHFRVIVENVVRQLVENPHTVSRREISKLVSRNPANLCAEKPQTVLIPESTQKITTETSASAKKQTKPRRAERYALPPDSMFSLTDADREWLRDKAPFVPDYDRATEKWFLKQQTNGGKSKTLEEWKASWRGYMMNYSDGEQSRNGNGAHGRNQNGGQSRTETIAGLNPNLTSRIKRAF
jgi:hypothetical protein